MRACWCCWCSPDDGRSVHFPGVCVLEALTTPVTFMMLGLPARAYLVILALLAANAVGHVCEAAWHHPDIAISWGKVDVALWSHDAGGVTERDFALAQKIEELLTWKPSGGPLEGTPDDPAYAYVLAD